MAMDTKSQNHDTVSFTVSYKGTSHPVTLPLSSTFSELQDHIAEIPSINVSPTAQKLMIRGKSSFPPDSTLSEIGIAPNAKILLIGSSAKEISAVQEATARQQQIAARSVSAARARLSRPAQPIRSFGDADDSSYTFHTIQTLPGFGDASQAQKILSRLRDDTAIRAIMRKYKWSVGVLKELHPNERTILGYNENKGHLIALRLRTNDLDGFRHYDSIRKVLLHELTHCVHSEHDAKFHALNRELNKECDSISKGKTVAAKGERYYNPPEEEMVDAAAFEGGTFMLGGGRKGERETRPMREILAEAALLRLTKEEEELVESCGSSSAKHQKCSSG